MATVDEIFAEFEAGEAQSQQQLEQRGATAIAEPEQPARSVDEIFAEFEAAEGAPEQPQEEAQPERSIDDIFAEFEAAEGEPVAAEPAAPSAERRAFEGRFGLTAEEEAVVAPSRVATAEAQEKEQGELAGRIQAGGFRQVIQEKQDQLNRLRELEGSDNPVFRKMKRDIDKLLVKQENITIAAQRETAAKTIENIERRRLLPTIKFASGLTLGMSDHLFDYIADELDIDLEPEDLDTAEKVSGVIAKLVGMTITAQGLQGAIAKKFGSRALLKPISSGMMIRGGSGAIKSSVSSFNEAIRGRISWKEAAGDVVQETLASMLSVLPELGLKPGAVNAIGQIGTDLVFDLISDLAIRKRLENQSFGNWFVTTELPQLVMSIVGASDDLVNPRSLRIKQTAARREIKDIKTKFFKKIKTDVKEVGGEDIQNVSRLVDEIPEGVREGIERRSDEQARVAEEPAEARAEGEPEIRVSAPEPLPEQVAPITAREVAEKAAPAQIRDEVLQRAFELGPELKESSRRAGFSKQDIKDVRQVASGLGLKTGGTKKGVIDRIIKAEDEQRALTERPAATAESNQSVDAVQRANEDSADFNKGWEANTVKGQAVLKAQKPAFLDSLTKALVDATPVVKRVLGRAASKDALMQFVLAKGSSAQAKWSHKVALEGIRRALTGTRFGTASGENMKLFAQYVHAKRTVEATELQLTRGKELKSPEGLGLEGSKKFLTDFERQPAEMQERVKAAAEVYWTSLRKELGALRSNGLISEELYQNLLTNHKFYSPRQFVDFIDPASLGTKGERAHDSGIKGLDEGSTSAMVDDPVFLLGQVIARSESRVFWNRANVELHDLIKANPDGSFGRILKGKQEPGPNERVINAFVDGVEAKLAVPAKFGEEWLESHPALDRDVAVVLQWASGTKPLKFVATSANPVFAFRNLWRDAQHSWFVSEQYSKHIPIAMFQQLADYRAVSKDAFNRTGRYEDFLAEGGGLDYMSTQGRIGITKPWQKRGLGSSKAERTAEGFMNLIEASEIMTRLAVRERAIKNGASPAEATYIARTVLDFAQGGRVAKAMDTVVPYFNAQIQGTRGTLRAFKNNPAEASYKAAQLAVMGYGAAHAFSALVPETWFAVSEEEKARNWVIPLGLSKLDKLGKKRWAYIRLPKDQGQQIFSAIGQSFSDGVNGKPWGRQIITALESTISTELSNLAVPLGNAFIAYYGNYDLWRKRKVSAEFKNIRADLEYNLTTPQVAKDTAEGINSAVRLLPEKVQDKLLVSPERLARATSKLIPTSNPVAAMLVDFYDIARNNQEVNDTFVEGIKKIPGLGDAVKFTNPSDVDAKTQEAADKFGVSTEGKTLREAKEDVRRENVYLNSSRKLLNDQIEVLTTKEGFDKATLKKWLNDNVDTREQKIRLWNKARRLQPEIIDTGFTGKRKMSSRARNRALIRERKRNRQTQREIEEFRQEQ